MPRVSRESLNTSFFHIITQGVNKEYIFNKKEYIEKYLDLINKYKEKYDISILAYCIMNNHAHLLLYIKDIANMSKFMHKIDGVFGQFYNKCEKRVGIVFRNRYVSEAIYNEKYLVNCINYIHMNPVKAGIAKKCDDYEYSSYKEFNKIENQVLIDILGKDYLQWINNTSNEEIFYDIEVNKHEIFKIAVKKFEIMKKDTLNNIVKDKNKLKELIKFLKINYKITYVDIMKELGITKGKMNSLRK